MTQADALTILKMGHNVYLTGSAGSGKTYVLNAYIKYLQSHGINVAITASTGIAATHMGGMTIHAWSGMGIKDNLSPYEIDQLEEKQYLYERYEKVRVLIIDEISMLSGTFLDILDRVCRSMKRTDKPFGGIQIVLCGDLFQLPPITRDYEEVSFVVQSSIWKEMNLAFCYLTESHRQNDDTFLEILNALRSNSLEPLHIEQLTSRTTEFDDKKFTNITKLFTHNTDVEAINHRALNQLLTEEHVFEMTGKGKGNLIETLKKSCLAPETLKLKVGAEVMFVKNNFDKGYVNGTRGTVIEFDETDMPVVKTHSGKIIHANLETWSIEDEGKVLASITQIPLRHAWAITVHKSQGMSLDSAVIDLSKTFAYGMGYVALSRVKTLNGLHLVGFSAKALYVDPYISVLDQEFQNLSVRAEERLRHLTPEMIQKSQKDFILRSGGTLEVVTAEKDYLRSERKIPTHEQTIMLINQGNTIVTVAKMREMTTGTIIGHIGKGIELGLELELKYIKPTHDVIEKISEAIEAVREGNTPILEMKLSPIKKYLDRQGESFTFDDIKLARLFIK